MYQQIPDSLWQKIKDAVLPWVRNLAAKWITRGVTYGAGAIAAHVAWLAPSADQQDKWVAVIVSGVCFAAGAAIDYLHHKADKA